LEDLLLVIVEVMRQLCWLHGNDYLSNQIRFIDQNQ